MQGELGELSTYAVAVRYPGASADEAAAQRALLIARRTCEVVLPLLSDA